MRIRWEERIDNLLGAYSILRLLDYCNILSRLGAPNTPVRVLCPILPGLELNNVLGLFSIVPQLVMEEKDSQRRVEALVCCHILNTGFLGVHTTLRSRGAMHLRWTRLVRFFRRRAPGLHHIISRIQVPVDHTKSNGSIGFQTST